MSDPDNFLSRWSRRKLEPSKEGGEQVAPETEQIADAQAGEAKLETPAASVPVQEGEEPPFDVASLPPIESITGGTDIRDFLKPGVPLSLSRAALRRAWTSDPAIRDFIGIAENQWDFTNNSIPGFGPIDPADIPGLLARIISSTKDGGEALAALTEQQPGIVQSAEPRVAKGEPVPAEQTDASPEQIASSEQSAQEMSQRSKENDAAQKEDEADRKPDYAHVRHGHGSALPN
jgi:hypothetical protein